MYYLTFIMFAIGGLLNVFDILNKRTIKVILVFFSLWMIFHDGLRWEIGTDWFSYYYYYQDCLGVDNDFEIGYQWVSKLLRGVTDNYSIFLIIHAAFVYIGFYWFNGKYSPYPLLSFFIMYYMMIGYMGMNRQYIALILCLFSIPYLLKKQYWRFVGIILFAMLFHVSALMFIFVGILNKSIPRKILFAILIVALFIAFSGVMNKLPLDTFMAMGERIGEKMDTYLEVGKEIAVSPLQTFLGIVRRGFWIFILLYNKEKLENKWRWFNLFFNIQFFALLFYILFSGTILQAIVGRGLLYFNIIEVIMIPCLFWSIKSKIYKSALYVVLLCLGLYLMNNSMDYYIEYGKDIYRPYNAIYMNNYMVSYE